MARLVPVDGVARDPVLAGTRADEVVEGFRRLRERLRASGVRPFTTEEIVDLVRSGRKY